MTAPATGYVASTRVLALTFCVTYYPKEGKCTWEHLHVRRDSTIPARKPHSGWPTRTQDQSASGGTREHLHMRRDGALLFAGHARAGLRAHSRSHGHHRGAGSDGCGRAALPPPLLHPLAELLHVRPHLSVQGVSKNTVEFSVTRSAGALRVPAGAATPPTTTALSHAPT